MFVAELRPKSHRILEGVVQSWRPHQQYNPNGGQEGRWTPPFLILLDVNQKDFTFFLIILSICYPAFWDDVFLFLSALLIHNNRAM